MLWTVNALSRKKKYGSFLISFGKSRFEMKIKLPLDCSLGSWAHLRAELLVWTGWTGRAPEHHSPPGPAPPVAPKGSNFLVFFPIHFHRETALGWLRHKNRFVFLFLNSFYVVNGIVYTAFYYFFFFSFFFMSEFTISKNLITSFNNNEKKKKHLYRKKGRAKSLSPSPYCRK